MSNFVTSTSTLQCSCGLIPGKLMVLPDKRVMLAGKPIATIMDFKPMVNIPSFGMCTSMANPTVASATSAAMGVLTPMPCIPNTTTPWIGGKMDVLINNQPVLLDSCSCQCLWAGCISIITDGQIV